MYLGALRALSRWAGLIGKDAGRWEGDAGRLASRFGRHLDEASSSDSLFWKSFGFHSTALALGQKVVPPAQIPAAIAFLKQHLLACFPNDRKARRLSGTTVESEQVITPFFLHHVLPVLVGHGEMDFVLGQIRACWGWVLECGLTTWPEVFDTRWSHCHQWSGCPTWILSRYALGLHPRFDLGRDVFEFKFHPGNLNYAGGRLPMHGGPDQVEISWKRTRPDRIAFNLRSHRPIHLLLPGGRSVDTGGEWNEELEVAGDGFFVPVPAEVREGARA
jgi:hypothetical protein